MVLSLSLATTCLAQASPMSRIIPNPEDYLLGVPEWFSAFLVFPVLGLSYVCLLVSHFAISALTVVFRLCLGRTRLLFLRYVAQAYYSDSPWADIEWFLLALPRRYSISGLDI